jgi:hypothetical protein
MEFKKEQINLYKEKYKSIFMYTANDGKSCILRSPDLQILDACRTISGGSSIRFDIALVDNCWIDGDIELKTIDKYMMGLFDWLGGIIQKIDGELKEL